MTQPHVAMLARATEIAMLAHEGQTRQGGRPYFYHPVRVSAMLAEYGASPDVVVSGVLHDVLEDSNVGIDAIISATNARVGHLVEGVTDSAAFTALRGVDRKRAQAEKYAAAERDVQFVKLGDQTDNLETMKEALKAGRTSWVRNYTAGAFLVAEACREACPALFERARRAHDATKESLEALEAASLRA